MTTSTALHRSLTDAIDAWQRRSQRPLDWPDSRFQSLAHRLFAHQYSHNEPYRTLCKGRSISPNDNPPVDTIPAVPTDAFKVAHLFCADGDPQRTFRTSGTTGDQRGAHHFSDLQTYRRSLLAAFAHFCLHDDRPQLPFAMIAPSANALPDSSLSFMLHALMERHGTPHSQWLVSLDDQGRWHLDIDAWQSLVDRCLHNDDPLFCFGTAFGFASLFSNWDHSVELPPGSRLVETGGFKGRFKSLTRQDLYQAFTDRLGLTPHRCLSEYSMTELSSQLYTDGFLRGPQATGRLYAPPWLRVSIVDPIDFEPLPTGDEGLIRLFDLANIDSVCAIQTSDQGRLHTDGGLTLVGRAPDADLRGCSLTIEELLDA